VACDEALERLGVYIDGYPARLQEALREAFPAVAHIIGGQMCALVSRFATEAQLRSYNLNDAGADFPRFLRGDSTAEQLPFLPDLAELEWRVLRAFHAADETSFDPASLLGWDDHAWSYAVLRFQPWVAIVSSEWPIGELWELRETPLDQIDVDLGGKPSHICVRRDGFAVICESVTAAEAHGLQLLLSGLPLGMAMEILNARGVAAESIGVWFQRWVTMGLICGVRLAGTATF
jgi:hypothetical protein